MAGDAADGFDDFADAGAKTVAKVVDKFVVFFQGVEGEQVGAGQVADVDVIANAGAVWRGIVGTKDGEMLAFALSDLQGQRDEMGFGMVIFTLIASGARGVEITETGVVQSVDAMEPGEHLLDKEFGFAVSIGGMEGVGFFDGDAVWSAIERGGGGKNEAWDFVFENGFEKS